MITHFKKIDGKYLTPSGKEITTAQLMANTHYIAGNAGWVDLPTANETQIGKTIAHVLQTARDEVGTTYTVTLEINQTGGGEMVATKKGARMVIEKFGNIELWLATKTG
jgi:hypothetical protein